MASAHAPVRERLPAATCCAGPAYGLAQHRLAICRWRRSWAIIRKSPRSRRN